MTLIWATRGHEWGFRFLLDGGFDDPLETYERSFSGVEDEASVCRRRGDLVALRFPDPQARRDSAGRVIPHDFVILPPAASEVRSVDAGLKVVWPCVAEAYASLWALPRPPASSEIEAAFISLSH